MLQSIEIENFRCFEKTAISGFEQINLITGKNNSGKTALLEALYFCFRGWSNGESELNSSVRESSKGGNDYKNLFFNQDDTKALQINSPFFGVSKIGNEPVRINDNSIFPSEIIIKFLIDKTTQLPTLTDLAKFFDDAFISGESKIVEESLQVIDNEVQEIRTFSSRPGILFLRKKEQLNYMPIYYFGDAVQKIVRYVINVLDFKNVEKPYKILLVDEIENGIHYTAQAEVWRMLIKLCKHYNIQLFATTHSLEMIKAFQQVCSEEEFTGMGGYFELGRQAKSQQIIAVKHDLETLEYELASGDTIRGE